MTQSSISFYQHYLNSSTDQSLKIIELKDSGKYQPEIKLAEGARTEASVAEWHRSSLSTMASVAESHRSSLPSVHGISGRVA